MRNMHLRRQLLTCILIGLPLPFAAHAQQVEQLQTSAPAPDLLNESDSPSSSNAAAPIDMGQVPAKSAPTRKAGAPAGHFVAGMSVPAPLAGLSGTGSVARAAAAQATLRKVGPAPLASSAGPAERAVFAREPVRVNLTVGQERLITLPSDAMLHVPADMDAVARIESIGGTLYVTAMVPFTPIRIIAELVDSGQQIPLDLVADKGIKASKGTGNEAAARGELQLSVLEPSTVPNPTARAAAGSAQVESSQQASPAADMVQLTRHAARQLYAPRRLAMGTSGVSQVGVNFEPVPTLLRGASVEAVPVGQWKSGNLYVTAVRITNRSRYALELPLESLRGRWLAATAQHGRIGAAGTDTDTTAVYLVCERSFESCL